MAIADVKDRRNLRRDILVRLTHVTDVTDDATYIGSNQWTVTYPYEPISVTQLGAAITYSYNSSTQLLTMTTAAGMDGDAPAMVATYICLCTGKTKYLDRDDPTGTITNVKEWQSRILTDVSVTQSIDDIFIGVVSLSSSTISIANDDLYINDFIGLNKSFYNQDVSIWLGLNENYELLFEGTIGGCNVSSNAASISIKSGLKKLNAPAYMGDEQDEAYLSSTKYPNINPVDAGKPIPFILGGRSEYKTVMKHDSSANTYRHIVDVNSLNEAYNINYKEIDDGAYGNNKVVLCRVPTNNLSGYITFNPTSISKVTIGSETFDKFVAPETEYLTPQAALYVSYSGASSRDTVVYILDKENNTFYVKEHPLSYTATGVELKRKVTVFSYDESTSTLTTRGIGITETSTSSGNYVVTCNLGNIFLSPELKFYYIINNTNSNVSHADGLQAMIEGTGLTIDSTTFNQADTDLVADVVYTIPPQGELEYKTYLEYIPIITTSTFGIIYFNNDREVEYKLIDSLGTPTIIINDEDILAGSLTIEVDYNDIKTDAQYINNYVKGTDLSIQSYAESKNSRYLHNLSSTLNIDTHLLDVTDVSSVKNRAFSLAKAPKIYYRMTLTMKFYDLIVGDEITVKSSVLDRSSIDLLVTSVEKSMSGITIIGIEVNL